MKNQKGFGVVELLIAVIVISLVGVAGWYVVTTKRSDSPAQSQPANEARPDPKTNPSSPDTTNICEDVGIIIVTFKNTTKDQQLDIIAAENATIYREYETISGYALQVGKGKQQAAIDSFLKHAEVASATADSCVTSSTGL